MEIRDGIDIIPPLSPGLIQLCKGVWVGGAHIREDLKAE